MKKYNYYRFQLVLLSTLGILLSFSCSKIDSTYRQFVKPGETIYVAKPDSLTVFPGHNRAMLYWLVMSDPSVSRYKILWNNQTDSLEGIIDNTSSVDTVRVLLPNLPEGNYFFDVYQYDNEGHSSVNSTLRGETFGVDYQQSLQNRSIQDIRRIGKEIVEITWSHSPDDLIGVDIKYRDGRGDSVYSFFSAVHEIDTLNNIENGGSFEYHSLFVPQPDSIASIDTFHTEYVTESTPVYYERLDKTLWKLVKLDNDTYKPQFSAWSLDHLWDNDLSTLFLADPKILELKLPNWFTIDLGKEYKFKSIRVNEHTSANQWMFNKGEPKIFEIYGSNSPDQDGSWNSWNLLGHFESIKPSGLPLGQLTDEDISVAKAGENFDFESMSQGYRYIRFKTIETWSGDPSTMMAEITLWGSE